MQKKKIKGLCFSNLSHSLWYDTYPTWDLLSEANSN